MKDLFISSAAFLVACLLTIGFVFFVVLTVKACISAANLAWWIL